MPSRPLARALVLISFLVALPSLAGNFRWTIQGPDGGAINHLEFDPTDSSIVYAASENGLFRSTDGGQHWVAARELLGKSVYNVAIAASDPQKLFASTVYGLYGSVDRGVTWRVAHGFGSFGVAASSDGAVVYSVSTGGPIRSADGGVTFGNPGNGLPPFASVTAIVADPQNADTIYISLLSPDGVYKSMDGGTTWTRSSVGLTMQAYYSLVIDPSNPATLYLGAGGAIYKTTNGGDSWSALMTSLYCYSVAISASTPSTIIAGADRGVLKSTNGGVSWSAPKMGALHAVAIDPANPANVLASASWNLFRSTDGGGSYTLTSSGLTSHLTQSIAVDPRNASTVYATGPSGIFRSTDRGQSWSAIGSTPTSALIVDPFDSSIVYAISSASIVRSVNGGATWQPFRDGLSSGSAYGLAADPQTAGTLYAIVGGAILRKTVDAAWAARGNGLPAGFSATFLTADRSTIYTGGAAGVFKSVDQGGIWTAISDLNAAGLAVDPYDSNHLFAWSNISLLESKNGGASWSSFAGLPASSTIAFDATAPGRVYARSFAEVKRSGDGGQTWASLANADGLIDTSMLAIAPDGKTLYAGGQRGGVWTFDFGRRRAAAH